MRSSLAFFFALALASCGSDQKSVDAHWTIGPEEEPPPARSSRELGPAVQSPEAKAPPGLLGVRHDLMLSKQASKAAACACLAVHIGSANDPAFFWTGGAPETGPRALAIAIGSRGVACPGDPRDEASRQPSISAIDQENENVIIEVEELPDGPPQASGAIIPAPGPGGSIYIRPRNAKVVYARSAEGRCRVR